MTNRTRTGIAFLGVALLTLRCEGRSPSGPTHPTAPAELTVTAISPTAGSTGGDTFVKITGTGFHAGVTVTVDGVNTRVLVQDGTIIHLTTEAHAAGQVDVVVTNPDGQTDGPSGGYIYAPPGSFDFNGTWAGAAGSEADATVRFTIANNFLTSLACGPSDSLPLSPPPPVSNGVFSVFSDDGASVSGRIVSATVARGTISVPPCTATTWVATRQ